jgi:hypothetical protein
MTGTRNICFALQEWQYLENFSQLLCESYTMPLRYSFVCFKYLEFITCQFCTVSSLLELDFSSYSSAYKMLEELLS